MAMSKQLWLLAGGNGAGKSTFHRLFLQPQGVPFVNADLIAKELFPDAPEVHSYHAARLAEELRRRWLLDGKSFCFETVFSHPSKIDFVAQAKALGYEIILVFIHLDSPALNNARVAQRVEQGGHAVPEDKVESRIPRTLNHIRTIIPLCDQVRVLDNSSALYPFRKVVVLRAGTIIDKVEDIPEWAVELLRFDAL